MAHRTLVSCLMVTSGSAKRLPLIERSLRSFIAQSHPRKELVIVCDGEPEDRRRLEAHVARLRCLEIRPVYLERPRPLGALRNLSFDEAAGDVLCQWDDDDHQHPLRLQMQLEALLAGGCEAVVLQNCLHVLATAQQCYWVNWGRTRYRGHPGTLMCFRGHGLRYPEEGPFARTGEDTHLWDRLKATVQAGAFACPPHLYAYEFHGDNTFDADHHFRLARRFCESRQMVLPLADQLRRGMEELGLNAGTLQLMDRDGPIEVSPGRLEPSVPLGQRPLSK